jgi:hypothetical protein
MAKLLYGMLTSLDGYTEDGHGQFGWGAPGDEEVHSYDNELASPVGTYNCVACRHEGALALASRALGTSTGK